MSQRGFHSYPNAPKNADGLRLKTYAQRNGTVGYMTDATGQEALFDGLRVNPHRAHLAKIGLFFGDIPDDPAELSGPDAESLLGGVKNAAQTLDLWTGKLTSRFEWDGHSVAVTTLCHPDFPLLSVRVESALVALGTIGLDLRFPYGSHEIGGADWKRPEAHESRLETEGPGNFRIYRTMDDCAYALALRFFGGDEVPCTSFGPHRWVFSGSKEVLEFSVLFSFDGSGPNGIPAFGETERACARHWTAFWNEGAAISFEGSVDPRAFELERRVVLSQYLLAIQSMGSLPPAETGLTCNSWYGKFHLEMHPWHALQGLLWNRSALVARSLPWYASIIDGARERARSQGYRGARWPKMTDPSGNDSPSPIGCLLCWQQPHPILFAELAYRLNPTDETLATFETIVFETAEFMANYPEFDAERDRYVLGPPLIPAQENHEPEDTLNPTFELEYWRWGLKTAVAWQRRAGKPVPEAWERVQGGLSECPVDSADPRRYAAHENCGDTYGRFATDHPSMLLAHGFLPPQTTDREIASNTCDAVLAHWKMETLWGWDFPALAMTFARLGRRQDAVDALLMESPKNTWMANGHNRQEGHDALPLYLPGNGALLLAVAMMAAGWDGSEGTAPGFPDDATWTVRFEGFARYI